MTPPRQQRALRASAAATLATFVALLSHVSAGGAPPSLLGVLLPWALSLPLTLIVVGHRLSIARLGAGVASAQLIFHAMFALGVVPSVGSATVAVDAAGDRGLQALHAAHMSLPASFSSPASPVAALPDAAMLGAHLLAAVVTTLLLHRAECLMAALGGLAQRIALRLRAVARDIVPPVRTPLRIRLAAAVRRRHPRPLIAAPSRRGPPRLLVL
ncbi:hypothetical protein [Microbacterium oleivorans]|uniref:Uncharacterized protein n=1 Tax=Microbacterium oleivorans TaxID=273677 RepID=A0A7D5JET0_9MICO|nr:hypothetical protein [Microbacterium oleivorans]QLD11318.1 hypothetical protein HW566_05730 [Microbacterium oleivorans]